MPGTRMGSKFRLNWPPALPRWCRSAAAFFLHGREFLRAPAAVAPVLGAYLPLLLRALPTARADVEHLVPRMSEHRVQPYTVQLCDRFSVRAPENRRREP